MRCTITYYNLEKKITSNEVSQKIILTSSSFFFSLYLIINSLSFHILDEILFKLDPKSLVIMQCTERSIRSHISNDSYFKSLDWEFYRFNQSLLPSPMELNEKVDVMTMVHDDERFSFPSVTMEMIDKISPYAQNLLKKKNETELRKRFLVEEETKLEVLSSSKFLNVVRINKRRRVK
ncbi:uncharacterized protein LOC112084027 [Eutrema salsugineum]|uniref:uncharacterized protein LOC112084027 n=1 Tax=Eutrema salsugineum TaxID=72664 RepID=UPI000CECEF3A|nr:uncharacterized protein LOC112084027 [Eutrema salsugineum]